MCSFTRKRLNKRSAATLRHSRWQRNSLGTYFVDARSIPVQPLAGWYWTGPEQSHTKSTAHESGYLLFSCRRAEPQPFVLAIRQPHLQLMTVLTNGLLPSSGVWICCHSCCDQNETRDVGRRSQSRTTYEGVNDEARTSEHDIVVDERALARSESCVDELDRHDAHSAVVISGTPTQQSPF
jgi:hypothetical protein